MTELHRRAGVVRWLLACLATLGVVLTAPSVVLAQAVYPVSSIKLIIPVPPGGAADLIGRLVARRLGDALGQTIVVENVGGATGTIAAQQVARAKPDGYTLLLSSSTTHGTAPAAFRSLPYDPIAGFTHIRLLATVPAVAVVTKSLPVNSIQELVAYSKAHPDQLNYGSSGNGSPLNFWSEMFKQASGASLNHVPYKGSGPAVTDLIAGRIQVMFDGLPAQISNIEAGNTRALAVLHQQRLSALPDTPTMPELGYPTVLGGLWYGVSGPAGLDPAVADRLDLELRKIGELPEFEEALRSRGILQTPLARGDYSAFIVAENQKYRRIAQIAGMQPE